MPLPWPLWMLQLQQPLLFEGFEVDGHLYYNFTKQLFLSLHYQSYYYYYYYIAMPSLYRVIFLFVDFYYYVVYFVVYFVALFVFL